MTTTTRAAPIDAALRLARAGLIAVPLNERRPDLRPLRRWADLEAADVERTRAWWDEHPGAGVGVVLGRRARGLIVLDIDRPSAAKPGRADGEASLGALEAAHGDLPRTRESCTPSGGRHLWLRVPRGARVRCSQSELGPGLDVIADGGLGRVPPTTCPRGAYRWAARAPIADAPAWLVELIRTPARPARTTWSMPAVRADRTTPYGAAALGRACGDIAVASEGGRNGTLNRAAFGIAQLVGGGEIEEHAALESLTAAAVASGLPEREARSTIASGWRAGLRRPRTPAPRRTSWRSGT